MPKSDKGANGGGTDWKKTVGLGQGFEKTGNDLKKKNKPGSKTKPKGNKKPPKGPGQIGKSPETK